MNHWWYNRNYEQTESHYRTTLISGNVSTVTINGVGRRLPFCMNFTSLVDSAGQSAGQLTGQDCMFFHKFWMNHWWYNRNSERTGPCYRTPPIPGRYAGTPTINGIIQECFVLRDNLQDSLRDSEILQDNLQDSSQDTIWYFSKFWMNHWWCNHGCERTGLCYRTPPFPDIMLASPQSMRSFKVVSFYRQDSGIMAIPVKNGPIYKNDPLLVEDF